MYVINTTTIGRAHELAIKKVYNHGKTIVTEDNEKTLELDQPLGISVSCPVSNPSIARGSPYDEKFMQMYTKQLLEGTDADFVYNYHDRLFHYKPTGTTLPETDQIQNIITKLKENENSRRAIAITWYPSTDITAKEPPCLQLLQFSIRDDRLNLTVVFRSNDILLAAGANMYALTTLQKKVAQKLYVYMGTYTHIANSAHIYYERDASDLQAILTAART